jgi:amino acid transporter
MASICIVTIANLRGAKESGGLFAIPTYTFIVLLFALLIFGFMQPAKPIPPELAAAYANPKELGTWAMVFLFAKAFSAGCTALTGVEAVANSTAAFRAPASRNATITLFIMAVILGTLFNGLSTLAERFHAMPMETGAAGFKTIVAQLASTTFGEKHWMFFAIQLATAAILFLAANTAYADFPRITGILARDGFMPRQFAALGDKLVHQNGIVLLAIVAAAVVLVSGGDVSKLVALYAIGVFVCFTLSQFGMVAHERKRNKPLKSYIVSLIGGSITSFVALVIFVSKFDKGSWIVLVAFGVIMFIFSRVFKHYAYLAKSLNLDADDTLPPTKGTVLLLVPRVHKGILQAISYGQAMAKDIRAVHVTLDKASTTRIKEDWQRFGADIPLVILESPYRSLLQPILDYIDQTILEDPDTIITVIVPQAVPKHWWQGILHNNAAVSLKVALGARRNVVITNVRYFLK